MTVGSLFVRLGFRVENKESFDRAIRDLGLAESKAINLKRGVIGLGAAFAGLMWFTTNAATNLFKFHLVTGLSTRALQDWQFAGARAGVAAAEIADVFKNLQQQQVAIQFGEGNLAPWALLGIDPRQDPMRILWQIHERVKLTAGMGAAQARYLTTQLGLSEAMFQFLRRDNLELGQLEEKFKITEEAQKTFDELNGKLAQMKEKLELVAMQFGVTFGPKLIEFMERFTRAGGPLDKFTDWLQKLSANTAEGEKMRAFWIHVAEGIGIAAAALAALNIASKVFMTGAAIKILFGGAAAAAGATTAGGAGSTATAAGATSTAGGLLGTLAIPVATMAGLFGLYKSLQRTEGRAYQTAISHGASPSEAKFYQDSVSQWKALIDLFRRGPYPWNPEQLYAPGYGPRGQGGQTTVTVTQNIRSTDPAAAGRESAAAIEKVMNQRMSAFVNMNAMGAAAH